MNEKKIILTSSEVAPNVKTQIYKVQKPEDSILIMFVLDVFPCNIQLSNTQPLIKFTAPFILLRHENESRVKLLVSAFDVAVVLNRKCSTPSFFALLCLSIKRLSICFGLELHVTNSFILMKTFCVTSL